MTLNEAFLKLSWKFINLYRRLPYQPFRNVLHNLYLVKIKPKQYADRTEVVVKQGIFHKLYLNEYIDNEIYYSDCWEPRLVRIFKKFVRPNMIVFDIEANIGAHALQLAKIVGKNGKVFAVEPNLKYIERLKENVKLNNFKNVMIIDKFFSDINQLKEITLDEYVRLNGINQIDFIKIDTEGYEYKIIKGAKTSIVKFKPIMVIEFSRTNLEGWGDRIEDLIKILKDLGYSFFSERNLREYSSDEELLKDCLPETTINVLCKIKKN